MAYIFSFMLVFSDNVLDYTDGSNNREQDYKDIEESVNKTLDIRHISEAEEHHPHVEQYEGPGDGDDDGG